MCGIVGIASDASSVSPELLCSMRDTMRHRGPDDAGLWISGDCAAGLAHTRLAIIDLSPGGHQPMSDASGRFWIAFNGEIYNYRDLRQELEAKGHSFRTASDTEVILEAYRAWGTDCLSRFNGMFAFALYDSASRHLFVARDRAGEKPLFYFHAGRRLVFASEIKALVADPAMPRRLDLQALIEYLAYGYVPGDMCILQGMRKLAPAHAFLYELETDSLRVWQYWKLPEPPGRGSLATDGELLERMEALLRDAVKRQLVADVPVGILLSGGLDSSLITAIAASCHSGPVRTFTIVFPRYGSYDEGPFARLVARHFATQHTELEAGEATTELLPQLARQYDEPNADSSMVPTYLVARLVRAHSKVALGGDGGDELFGGYSHYSWLQSFDKIRLFLPQMLRSGLANSLAPRLPSGFRGRNYLRGLADGASQLVSHVNIYFDADARERLIAPLLAGRENRWSPEGHKAKVASRGTVVQNATAADFLTYLPDDLLMKVDRASMLTSLEVRAPFLDYRLIEFAFGSVPDRLRATRSKRKILERRLAARLLPKELDLTRKRGFSLPLSQWFKGQWGAFVQSVLNEADPRIFNQEAIRDTLNAHRRGYSNTQRLFALTIFELWRREYRIAVP